MNKEINVLETLQKMKPDIQVVVWENALDKIVYNEKETFRPTKEEIIVASQSGFISTILNFFK